MEMVYIDLKTDCVSGHQQHVNVAIHFGIIVKRVKVNTFYLEGTYLKVRTVESLSVVWY